MTMIEILFLTMGKGIDHVLDMGAIVMKEITEAIIEVNRVELEVGVFLVGFIIAMVIGYGINELLGAIK